MDSLSLDISPLREAFDLILTWVEHVPGLRELLGFGLIFILPGFSWSLVFFRGRQVSILERVVLSFGLSVALVTLGMFGLNLIFGVRVTGFNAVVMVVLLTIFAFTVWYCCKRRIGREWLLRFRREISRE